MSTAPLTPAEMLAAAQFTPSEQACYDVGYMEGWQAGYAHGHWLGFADGYDTHGDEVSNWLAGTPQKRNQPLHSELLAARTVDHQPCPRKCRSCSRCIHSLAYYGRGGRDFLGVEAERQLAAGVSNETGAAA